MAIPTFHAEEWQQIRTSGSPNGRPVAYVLCDRERPRDCSDLIGAVVEIDGRRYRCTAVERHALGPGIPIRKGETIGLLVEELGDPAQMRETETA